MVNPDTKRLYYEYIPEKQRFSTMPCPIRDMGNVYDLASLCHFLEKENGFQPVIETSIHHFSRWVERKKIGAILNSDALDEPSSIAHSAMLIMCLVEVYTAPPLLKDKSHEHLIKDLADGILAQQRTSDGSYKVYFSKRIESDKGLEFYASEAMLALMTAYEYTGEKKYLESVEKAFPFYMKYYWDGLVSPDLLIFFANWQSQSASKFLEKTNNTSLSERIIEYVYQLHDRIIMKDHFYKNVKEDPSSLATVQVACALEGLADAYNILIKHPHPDPDDWRHSTWEKRKRYYRESIDIAVDFLLLIQKESAVDQIAEGGFGHGLFNKTQRLDVTGHVLSSFIKLCQVLKIANERSI
jgi:hypothetical protein